MSTGIYVRIRRENALVNLEIEDLTDEELKGFFCVVEDEGFDRAQPNCRDGALRSPSNFDLHLSCSRLANKRSVRWLLSFHEKEGWRSPSSLKIRRFTRTK
jgi:hypothetical protein